MHTVKRLVGMKFINSLEYTKPGYFSEDAKVALYCHIKDIEEKLEMLTPCYSIEVDFSYIVDHWKEYPSALDVINEYQPFNNNEPITTEEDALEYLIEHSEVIFINEDSRDGIIINKHFL